MTRNRRNAFREEIKPPASRPSSSSALAQESVVFEFFRDLGVRETIESILVAVMLALIFRVFLAEAFVIPTGSMAPSLKGAHKEITCDESGFTYAVGASSEEQRNRNGQLERIVSTFCPIDQHETKIRTNDSEHGNYSGDRILVNKFIYDFIEPERFDVIVFKNPNNGKQNYIKRLIGLPGDNVLIENGDIYLMHQQADGTWVREIARKPPEKIRTTLQVVDDTLHLGKTLKKLGWPERWQQFRGKQIWSKTEVNDHTVFSSPGSGDSDWLRYRHFRPYKGDWENNFDRGELPLPFRDPNKLPAGSLIVDHYAYNDLALASSRIPRQMDGYHWVGDIGLVVDVEITSTSGLLLLDLVEGGAHFRCQIDVATGQAKLSCDRDQVQFVAGEKVVPEPTGSTRIAGPGKYQLLYLNADDRLHLWVDGRMVEFDGAEYLRNEIPIPHYSENDPGDAEPLGIATRNLAVNISRLQVVRDLYYTSVRGNENASSEANFSAEELFYLFQDPKSWSSTRSRAIFTAKKGQTKPMFQLERGATREQDQFLPMGDNSPQSLDGRIWDGPHFFERDLLIGRAVFVYFPRLLSKPIPYFPNFKDMRFIR